MHGRLRLLSLRAICLGAMALSLASPGAWPSARAAGQECNLLANGGFERAGHLCAKRLAAQSKAGLAFDGADPLLPVGCGGRSRWPVLLGGCGAAARPGIGNASRSNLV